MSIKVVNEVEVCEENGQDVPLSSTKTLFVESHATNPELVVLKLDQLNITVEADDLIMAIGNATRCS